MTIDMAGNRFWVEKGELQCAPINADGTLDAENAGPVEAMSPWVQDQVVQTIKILEADSINW